MINLQSSISEIKGIGAVKKKLFAKLDIYTVEDLLFYYPKNYKDKSKLTLIENVVRNEYTTIKGKLQSMPIETRVKSNMIITKVKIADETGIIEGVWFNNRFIKNMLKMETEYYFYGKIGNQMGRTIEVPEFEKTGQSISDLLRIVPEYSLTEGLTQRDLRNAVKFTLESLEGAIEDEYDKNFREKFSLAEINFAFYNLHFPNDFFSMEEARKRFKFEELLTVQYGLSKLKENTKKEGRTPFQINGESATFIETLPFSLTLGQLAAIDDIKADFKSGLAMNRLIQGDVGSGKTIIAIIALLICVENGCQGAFLVPTEILAEQHLESLKGYFKEKNLQVEILKGSIGAKRKNDILDRLKKGEIDIIVGTHALLEEGVVFKNLGLMITDEQHRFGVQQRAMAAGKGESPHVLVMTATPIPRTLTLILYGDLDISVIRDKPKNRKKIETYTIDSGKKIRMYGFLKKHIDQGRQAYIICPLIEQNENLDLNSATEYYELLHKDYFKDYKLALLHGKMKTAEKDEIMKSFREGNIDILIATTVVEVGVDVSNATIIVIENAERFGLSQLHQLRGRVGRGSDQSYCILVSDAQNNIAKERLKIMTSSDDGFIIAEKDLELRGGGEILGLRQHGAIQFKIADILNDVELLKTSREATNYLNESNEYEKTKIYLLKKLNKIMEVIILN